MTNLTQFSIQGNILPDNFSIIIEIEMGLSFQTQHLLPIEPQGELHGCRAERWAQDQTPGSCQGSSCCFILSGEKPL